MQKHHPCAAVHRRRHRGRGWLCAFLVLASWALDAGASPTPTSARSGGNRPPGRLEPWCRRIFAAAPATNPESTPAAALAGDPLAVVDEALLAQGRVRLTLDTGPDGPPAETLRTAWEEAIPSLSWEGSGGRTAQVTLAIVELPRLDALPGLFCARPPICGTPLELVVSEGVAAIGAPALHALGIDGAGLRVGIIDQGFAGLGNLLGNEIPADTRARSFYGSPSGDGDLTGAGTAHGTTCAEIVHDVAPGAQLFLANALTPIEFQAAVRWMRDQGVAVISHSIGWFEGGGDGTGPIHDIVNEALDAGILWVNAAGNEARSYWGGPFIDSDGNGLHEFDAAGDETITHTIGDGGRGFTLVLTWDRWPYSTDLAFDIEIYENGDLAASSETLYEPRYAYRALAHARSLGKRLDIAIRRTLGDEPAHLRLFRLDSSDPIGEHGTAEGSLLVPADGARVLAVGAYRVTDGRLEEFSSRGPTVDGIAKPEVCAPDFVSTATDSPFVGTSAAAPHAAGVAALLLQTAPQAGFFDFRWSAGELRQWMSTAAAPDTFADPNAAAWGLLRAPDFAEPTNAAGRYPLEFISPTRLPLAARCMQASNAPWTLEIFDPAGRRLLAHSFPRIDPAALIQLWDGSRGGAARIGNGCYLLRARGAGWSKTQPIVVLR